jgi:hypothetical protein
MEGETRCRRATWRLTCLLRGAAHRPHLATIHYVVAILSGLHLVRYLLY